AVAIVAILVWSHLTSTLYCPARANFIHFFLSRSQRARTGPLGTTCRGQCRPFCPVLQYSAAARPSRHSVVCSTSSNRFGNNGSSVRGCKPRWNQATSCHFPYL